MVFFWEIQMPYWWEEGKGTYFGQTGGTRGVADGVDVIRARRGHGLAVSLTDGLDFRERVDGQTLDQ